MELEHDHVIKVLEYIVGKCAKMHSVYGGYPHNLFLCSVIMLFIHLRTI